MAGRKFMSLGFSGRGSTRCLGLDNGRPSSLMPKDSPVAEASELFHETDSTASRGGLALLPVAVPLFSLVNSDLLDRPGAVQGEKRLLNSATERRWAPCL